MSVNGRLDKIYKQIGNAVPVLLARAIVKPIAEYAVNQPVHQDDQLVLIFSSYK